MKPFAITIRVYYEDTDAGGIVYHSNYLKFCERARTEWLRCSGISQQKLLQEGLGFVVARLKAVFKKSARLDDILLVSCTPIRIKRAVVTLMQEVTNEKGELLFSMECEIAYLNTKTGSLCSLDSDMAEYIQNCIRQNEENLNAD